MTNLLTPDRARWQGPRPGAGWLGGDRLKRHRHIRPKQIIVRHDTWSKCFDERNDRADLTRVVDALIGVANADLRPFRKPPGDVRPRFILSFVRRDATTPFLVIEVR